MTRGTTQLTEEQQKFYRTLLIRATSPDLGQPYIAYALFELIPVSAPGLKTMAVDKHWRVYIDFEYMKEKGVEYAAGVLNHEPWHLLRDHMRRFEGLDILDNGKQHNAKAWNIAGDLTINGDIPKLVPEDGCFPEKGPFADYRMNTSAEEYYAQLMKDEKFNPPTCPECGKPENKDKDKDKDKKDKSDKKDKGDSDEKEKGKSDEKDEDGEDGEDEGDEKGDGGEGDQDGDGSGEGDGSGHGHGSGECDTCGEPSDGDGSGEGSGEGEGSGGGLGGMPQPMCGSGSGNKAGDYELSEDEAKSVDSERGDQIRQTVATDMKQYEASNPGKLPGSLKIWAENELKAEPIDWRQLLRGQIKKAISSWTKGKMDYRRSKPNRRQPSRDFIFPAMQAPKPRLAVAIDTSGSHLHKLPVVIDQIVDLTKQVGVRGRDLLAFGVDVQITDVKPVNDPRKVLDDMVGGGGTDMCVGIEQLAELGRKNKADIGIMLTDLQTGWPTERPHGPMRYIVCGIVDSSNEWEMQWVEKAREAIGDWAEIVVIDVDAAGKAAKKRR